MMHNHLMYKLLRTEHLVYFKKQSYVCIAVIYCFLTAMQLSNRKSVLGLFPLILRL